MRLLQDWKRKRKLNAQRRARQSKVEVNWDTMINSLDDETRQETALRYLRAIDNTSLKRLYEAVDLYRKADKILKEKVKDPEPEISEDMAPEMELQPEVVPVGKEENAGKGKSDTGKSNGSKSAN